MKCIHTTLALALGLTAAGSALAWQDNYYDRYDHARYDYARVIDVHPIIDRRSEPVRRDVCYQMPVDRYQPGYTTYRERDRTGPTIAGAIIGGALGNLAGKGDGRKAATVAGALIGGTIGHNTARGGYESYRSGGYYERDYEQECRSETNWRNSDEVIGYDVTYRYEGRTYHTTLDHHPGSRLRIRVGRDVMPAE